MKFDRDSSIKRVGEPKPAAQGARARRAEGGERGEGERIIWGVEERRKVDNS